MRKFELQLIDVLKIQSYSGDFMHMSNFICKKIKALGLEYTKDKLGNIYVVKGDSDVYPTMVCHIDTVHKYNPNYKVFQAGRNIFAVDKMDCARLGVGGDDKVGVFMTLKMLEHRDVFKAAFFVDEEIGCVGSRDCNFDFFENSSLVLECDRKGDRDFVSDISGTKLYSNEFSQSLAPILKAFKRQEVSGGMTDVLEIAYNTKVCVANMSCGYYEPHSDEEYVNIDDVHDTYLLCSEIYDEMGYTLWRVSEDRTCGYGYKYWGYGGYTSKYSSKLMFDDIYDDPYIDAKKEDVGHCHDGVNCPVCNGVQTAYDKGYSELYCFECDNWFTEQEFLLMTGKF